MIMSPVATRSRPCVRCVLCSFAFPLAPALCSTNSAASETPCSAWAFASALFVGFPARIAGSDFSRSCIVSYGSSPPDADRRPLTERSNASSPGSQRQRASAHARVFDHAGPYERSRCRAHLCCLPQAERRRHPGCGSFAARWLAYALPYRRFVICDARLGADVVRYSFIAVDFHHQLLAGL